MVGDDLRRRRRGRPAGRPARDPRPVRQDRRAREAAQRAEDGARGAGRDRAVAGRGRRRARLTATFPTRRTAPPDHRGTLTMTTDAKPRIKITYATLRADNEELHAGFEARRRARPRASLGGHHRNFIDGAWRDGDGTFEVRSPIDRDIVLGTFATRHRADVDDAVAAARAAQPAWAAVAVARAPRDPAPRRRPHQRPADGLLRGHGLRGRQEPDRGARRGRGVGRPDPLLRPDDGGQRRLRPPDGQPRRRRGPHPLDPAAARRLRGHQPVQLPDGAGRRARRAPR